MAIPPPKNRNFQINVENQWPKIHNLKFRRLASILLGKWKSGETIQSISLHFYFYFFSSAWTQICGLLCLSAWNIWVFHVSSHLMKHLNLGPCPHRQKFLLPSLSDTSDQADCFIKPVCLKLSSGGFLSAFSLKLDHWSRI